MLNQNYLKAFVNSSGTVTIASGEQGESPLDDVRINHITVDPDDLITLSEALVGIANLIDEEENCV